MVSRARVSAMGAALLALSAGAGLAQRQSPEHTPGAWRAMKTDFTNYPPLTRQERREVLDQFTAVVNVLKDAATLKPPVGLELTPSISNIDVYSRFVVSESQPLPAMMWIRMNEYTTSCPTCPVAADRLWDGAFIVIANDLDALYGNWRSPAWKVEEDWYYVEPRLVAESRGVRHYDTGSVVTARTEPLFVAVTQERFLRARIAEARRELTRVEALTARGTPAEQNTLERDERARRWEKILEEARRYHPPEKIAEMRAQLEKTERELDGQFRKSEAADRARLDQGLKTVRDQLQELEGELVALGEARTAPALSCGTARRSGLCAKREGPDVRRLVVVNPRFFDASAPRTKFQLLLLLRQRATKRNVAANRAFDRTWETLDWSRLLALVR